MLLEMKEGAEGECGSALARSRKKSFPKAFMMSDAVAV